jgi:hypothetical protein
MKGTASIVICYLLFFAPEMFLFFYARDVHGVRSCTP